MGCGRGRGCICGGGGGDGGGDCGGVTGSCCGGGGGGAGIGRMSLKKKDNIEIMYNRK